jgi:uncharacterized membrane protein YagU involved in acid resistance
MTTTTAGLVPESRSNTGKAVLFAWLLAGTLDIGDAIVMTLAHGKSPIKMLQGIASALLDKETAAHGGLATAAFGLGLHFAIMLAMVSVFVFAARRWPVITRMPFVAGPLYGIVLYLIMYKIVLPTRWPGPPAPFKLEAFANQIFAHTILVGLSMALVTAAVLKRSER